MYWFKEGDYNTIFFYFYVKGRKKRLDIQQIEDRLGRVSEVSQEISEEAINIFQDQFTKNNNNFDVLNTIPRLLTIEDREQIEVWPEESKIKQVVFELNKDSASGSGGYSRKFYQSC